MENNIVPIRLTELINVIHNTIIKNMGKNEIILKEIQQMEYLIKGSKELENYSVNDIESWQEIVSKLNQQPPLI